MRHASIFTSIAVALGAAVVIPAPAAAGTLPQIEIEVGRAEIISAPLAGAMVTQVTSSNTAVRADAYGTSQVQIVGDKPGGQFEVDFFDSVHRVQYRQPVWVVDSGKLASAGFDRTRIQLPQLVMLPRRKQPVPVPGGGNHQISRIASSNPGVAAARTNTANTIMVWSAALGDSFIDFTDNATGKRYQLHVWVRNDAGQANRGAGGGGGRGGARPQPRPIGGGVGGGSLGPFDPCLVGHWRSQLISWNTGGERGGAGIMTTIKPDGAVAVDYGGMQVIRGALGQTSRLRGSATGRITAHAGSARVLRVDQSTVFEESVDPRGRRSTTPMNRGLGYGVPAQGLPGFSYSCGATSLVYRNLVYTYSFARLQR